MGLSLSFSLPSQPPTFISAWCGPVMRVGLEIPGGGRRADPALCQPAMRGDPGIRAVLVQAGSLETDWDWHRDSHRGREGAGGR